MNLFNPYEEDESSVEKTVSSCTINQTKARYSYASSSDCADVVQLSEPEELYGDREYQEFIEKSWRLIEVEDYTVLTTHDNALPIRNIYFYTKQSKQQFNFVLEGSRDSLERLHRQFVEEGVIAKLKIPMNYVNAMPSSLQMTLSTEDPPILQSIADHIVEQMSSECNLRKILSDVKLFVASSKSYSFISVMMDKNDQMLINNYKNEQGRSKPAEPVLAESSAHQKLNIFAHNSRQSIPEGLRLKTVLGNGDCFYAAVLPSIAGQSNAHLSPDQESKEIFILRQKVANYLEKNRVNFEHFFESGEFEKRLSAIRLQGDLAHPEGWGDDHEIKALTSILEQDIIVIGPDGRVRNVMASDLELSQNFYKDPIYIRYNGFNHYDALIVEPGFSFREIYQRLIAEAGPAYKRTKLH